MAATPHPVLLPLPLPKDRPVSQDRPSLSAADSLHLAACPLPPTETLLIPMPELSEPPHPLVHPSTLASPPIEHPPPRPVVLAGLAAPHLPAAHQRLAVRFGCSVATGAIEG